MDLQLIDKLALVTGSTAGIGRAIAKTLATEGASVIVNGRSQEFVDKAIAEHQYEPAGFKLSLGLKDLTPALQTSQASNMPIPLASLVHDRFLVAMAKERGDLEWAAIALEVSEAAGIKKV